MRYFIDKHDIIGLEINFLHLLKEDKPFRTKIIDVGYEPHGQEPILVLEKEDRTSFKISLISILNGETITNLNLETKAKLNSFYNQYNQLFDRVDEPKDYISIGEITQSEDNKLFETEIYKTLVSILDSFDSEYEIIPQMKYLEVSIYSLETLNRFLATLNQQKIVYIHFDELKEIDNIGYSNRVYIPIINGVNSDTAFSYRGFCTSMMFDYSNHITKSFNKIYNEGIGALSEESINILNNEINTFCKFVAYNDGQGTTYTDITDFYFRGGTDIPSTFNNNSIKNESQAYNNFIFYYLELKDFKKAFSRCEFDYFKYKSKTIKVRSRNGDHILSNFNLSNFKFETLSCDVCGKHFDNEDYDFNFTFNGSVSIENREEEITFKCCRDCALKLIQSLKR